MSEMPHNRDAEENNLEQPELHNALKQFRAEYSPRTLKAHHKDFLHLAVVLEEAKEFSPDDVSSRKEIAERFAEDLLIWKDVLPVHLRDAGRKLIKSDFARSSIERFASTLRNYIRLAAKRAAIDRNHARELLRVCDEISFSIAKEASDSPGPHSNKKATAVEISQSLAESLKNEHDLSQIRGIRDALIMHLLINEGLQCSEIVGLRIEDIDHESQALKIHRRRMEAVSTRSVTLSSTTWELLQQYLIYANVSDQLIRRVRNAGNLVEPMTRRGVNVLVREIGRRHGIDNLAPSDCHTYWARHRKGKPL
jgi:site-specific recombinase XerD